MKGFVKEKENLVCQKWHQLLNLNCHKINLFQIYTHQGFLIAINYIFVTITIQDMWNIIQSKDFFVNFPRPLHQVLFEISK